MKRAIYFDDTERELMRRILDYLDEMLGPEHAPEKAGRLTILARAWTRDNLGTQRVKFEEPVE